MSSVLRSLVIRVGADLSGAQSGLKQAAKDFKANGKTLTTIGSGLTSGLTVPILGAAVGLGVLAAKSFTAADGLVQMSDKTGLNTDKLQEMTYVGADLGVSLDTITGAQSKLIKAMSAAKDESSAQGQAFKALNVDAVDPLTGQLRDSNVVFGEVVDALGEMTNPTERDALSLKLLGKSALELNPLIKAGSERIAELTAEARKNGAVLKGEQVDALDKAGDAFEKAEISMKTAAAGITVALLPALEAMIPVVQNDVIPIVKGFSEFVGGLVESFMDLPGPVKIGVAGFVGLAVAIGPALSIAGKFNMAMSTISSLVLKASIALGAKAAAAATAAAADVAQTAATVASETATVGATVATGTETVALGALTVAEGTAATGAVALQAALGPIVLIIAATIAIIALAKYSIENYFATTTQAQKDMEASAIAMTESQTAVETATAASIQRIIDYSTALQGTGTALGTSAADVENYASTFESAADKMAEWDGGITEAQGRISELAKTVADESREYTDAEKEEITNLIGTIDDYTKKKNELYKTHMDVLQAMVENEKDMSAEASDAYLAQAQAGYEDLKKLADTTYADSVASAIEHYGVEGSLNKKAYDQAILDAQTKREGSVAIAEDSRDRVVQATVDTFIGETTAGVDYLNTVAELNKQDKALQLEKLQARVAADAALQETADYKNATDIEKWNMICEMEAGINATYDQKILDADAALLAAQEGNGADQAAALVALTQSMADAGLAIDATTLLAVNAYLESMGLAKINAEATAQEVADSVSNALNGVPASAATAGTDTGFAFVNAINASILSTPVTPVQLVATFAGGMNLPALPAAPVASTPKARAPMFAVGTRYLPSDMIIQAHKGEAIIPESENPYANSGGSITGSGGGISEDMLYRVMSRVFRENPSNLSLDSRVISTSTNAANNMTNRQLGKAVTV